MLQVDMRPGLVVFLGDVRRLDRFFCTIFTVTDALASDFQILQFCLHLISRFCSSATYVVFTCMQLNSK